MNIAEFLDKENLHHAYLLEGARDEIVPSLKEFLEVMGIRTAGNSDFIHIHLDTFKMDDAREFKSYSGEKSFGDNKKIFIISTNSFLREAQNALLKMFEEPIAHTHFFIVVPDINLMLPTVVSRCFVIKSGKKNRDPSPEAMNFLRMSLRDRVEFLKELLAEDEEEDLEGNEILPADSVRSKALSFLNEVENALHGKLANNFIGLNPSKDGTLAVKNSLQASLEHILKVRKFLRMPGSSAKTMMESVALVAPVIPSF